MKKLAVKNKKRLIFLRKMKNEGLIQQNFSQKNSIENYLKKVNNLVIHTQGIGNYETPRFKPMLAHT